MNDVITFSRTIKYIMVDDNAKVDLPEWCSKRISYYKYNKIERILYIACKECGEPFAVLKLVNNNGDYSWKDVHKEEAYHFISETSGFDAFCNRCKENIKRQTIEDNRLKQQSVSTIREKGNNQKKGKKDGGKKKGFTIFLSDENKLYVRLRKALNGDEISTFINSLIDEAREANPLKVVDQNGKEVKVQENSISGEEEQKDII